MTADTFDRPAAIDPKETKGPPIFIVGLGRSGTTLLRLMLCAHPRIYICHELDFYQHNELCSASVSGNEFLDYYLESLSWLKIDAAAVKARLPAVLPRARTGLAFEEIMRVKAAGYGRVRFGDKSPGDMAWLGRLFANFPEARVVHIVRDPRTNVASVSRMPWGSTRDEVNCLFYENARKMFEKYADRMLRVRLEDLASDPRREMARILDFVGESWDEAVLDHANHLVDGDDTPPLSWFEQAREAVDPSLVSGRDLSAGRTRTIEVLCRKSMSSYDYQLSKPVKARDRLWADVKLITALPELVRYVVVNLDHLRSIRKPADWSSSWKRYLKINPSWWRRHPADREHFETWVRASGKAK